MLGNRRLADAEFRRDRLHYSAGRVLASGQQFQDPTPHGISEDVQCVHSVNISILTYIS